MMPTANYSIFVNRNLDRSATSFRGEKPDELASCHGFGFPSKDNCVVGRGNKSGYCCLARSVDIAIDFHTVTFETCWLIMKDWVLV